MKYVENHLGDNLCQPIIIYIILQILLHNKPHVQRTILTILMGMVRSNMPLRGGFKNPSHGYTARLQLLTDSSPASSTPIVTSLCIPQTISIHTYASKIPPTTILVCRTPHCMMSFDYISFFHFAFFHFAPTACFSNHQMSQW